LKLYSLSDNKDDFHKGIPILTSETDKGYLVSSSSTYPGKWACVNAFNDDVKNAWASASWSSANAVVSTLQVKLPRPRIFNAVEIAARGDASHGPNQAPKDFRIEGSIDGEHWTVLKSESVIPWALGERRCFILANEREFLYYHVIITTTQGDNNHSVSVFNLGNVFKRE